MYHLNPKSALTTIQTKNLDQNIRHLTKFFNTKPSQSVKINFIFNREEMKKHWGVDTKISAMVDNKDPYQIYIYHPSVFEKHSDYKLSDYLPILTHEIAHTFVTQINPRCFSWMNEGICEFVVDENMYDNRFSKNNWNWCVKNKVFTDPKIDWLKFIDHDGYEIAFNLTKYIINNFSKNKFIELLAINRDETKNNYSKVFSTILNYNFEELLTDFGKTLKLH